MDAEALPGPSPQEIRRAATWRKVREHRQRWRTQAMRPFLIWVPDVPSAGFAAEARRLRLLANARPEEADLQAFMDSVSESPDDHESP